MLSLTIKGVTMIWVAVRQKALVWFYHPKTESKWVVARHRLREPSLRRPGGLSTNVSRYSLSRPLTVIKHKVAMPLTQSSPWSTCRELKRVYSPAHQSATPTISGIVKMSWSTKHTLTSTWSSLPLTSLGWVSRLVKLADPLKVVSTKARLSLESTMKA